MRSAKIRKASLYFLIAESPALVLHGFRIWESFLLHKNVDDSLVSPLSGFLEAMSTIFRLEFINKMGQGVSLAHMAHLLLSCMKILVIAGVYNN